MGGVTVRQFVVRLDFPPFVRRRRRRRLGVEAVAESTGAGRGRLGSRVVSAAASPAGSTGPICVVLY